MAEVREAGRLGDEAVRARTGRVWEEWFRELDEAGAQRMSHKEIVAHLGAHHEIDGWWQQMITVTYEQARGLRDKHQRPDGYQVGGSKTIPVPVSTLFRAWEDAEQRERWLPGAPLAIRRSTPEKSLRATWTEDDSRIDVDFYAKGEAKSQVSLSHGRLADAERAARMKAFWAERLEELKRFLGG